jgi:ABC-type phosphate transport system substrate-binding protein
MIQPALRKTLLASIVLAAAVCFNGCSACSSSHLEGTYIDSANVLKVEIKSDGKATVTAVMSNSSADCTYTVNGTNLQVNCGAQIYPFTIQSDGSLAAPPDSQMGVLKKTS